MRAQMRANARARKWRGNAKKNSFFRYRYKIYRFLFSFSFFFFLPQFSLCFFFFCDDVCIPWDAQFRILIFCFVFSTKKHTREENVVFEREFYIFSHACCRRIKSRRRRDKRNWSDFFAWKRQKREGQNFFQNSASFFPSSSSHIISITLSFVVSLCHVQKTTNRESFCE